VNYARSRTSRRQSWGAAIGTLFVSLLLLGIFAGSVYVFRKKDPSPEPKQPVPVAVAAEPVVIPAQALADTAADLIDQRSSQKIGEATRGEKDGLAYFHIVMTPPPIDRATQAYVVWLLRPVPFDFFPAGEMVTNDAGEFVIDWLGEKDKTYNEYTRVIVTLQPKGTPDPGAPQVIKATFGAE